jgi:hypothetical protein
VLPSRRFKHIGRLRAAFLFRRIDAGICRVMRQFRIGDVAAAFTVYCLDRDAAGLTGRNRYATSSKGGPQTASAP